jgi:hypothetical protein
MNIFVLDRDPRLAARAHCDTHVVKMVLETAQLLSTAHAHFGEAAYDKASGEWRVGGRRVYCPTHMGHPCAVWVRETPGNYRWAYKLLEHLLNEYQRRYGDAAKKRHKTWEVFPALREPPRRLSASFADRPDAMTPFALAMPEQHRGDDPVASYRAYYRADKSGIASYRLGNTPEWMAEARDMEVAL